MGCTLYLSCNKTTSQEICAWDICKDCFPVSQVIMMPLEIIPYIHCKKLKVVLTLLWLFELQIEYIIAIELANAFEINIEL